MNHKKHFPAKTKLLTTIIIMFFVAICGGCSNKDAFVGEWNANLHNGENILKLYESGDYTWYREDAIVPYVEGKWKIKGDSLCMSDQGIDHTGKYFIKYYVIRVNEHQLFLKDYWGIIEFEKSIKSF